MVPYGNIRPQWVKLNCLEVSAIEPHILKINNGSANDLVLSDTKPLPELILTKISCCMVSVGHTELLLSHDYTANGNANHFGFEIGIFLDN